MGTRKKASIFLGMFVLAFTIMFAKSQIYITAETVSHHTYLQQHESQSKQPKQVAVAKEASVAHVYVSNQTDSDTSNMNLIWILAGGVAVVCFGATKLSGNLL